MSAPLLPDALWNLIQPMLPTVPHRAKGGRPRLPHRACLTGILFVLRSGIPWEMPPQELGCGSGMTCWRRLRDWQEAGIWKLIHFVLLDWLARCGRIDWWRAVVDGSSVRAVFGGQHTGPNPTDRATLGSKRHLICDGHGVPLAIHLTGANRNDSQQALALVDPIPPLQGERGRPRHRPDSVLGDRGCDSEAIRQGLRAANHRYLEFISTLADPSAGVEKLRKLSQNRDRARALLPGFQPLLRRRSATDTSSRSRRVQYPWPAKPNLAWPPARQEQWPSVAPVETPAPPWVHQECGSHVLLLPDPLRQRNHRCPAEAQTPGAHSRTRLQPGVVTQLSARFGQNFDT